MEPSTFIIPNDIGGLAKLMLKTLSLLRLIELREPPKSTNQQCSNLTLINLMLVLFGPMHESKLTRLLLIVQFCATLIAFFIRYGLSEIFY